MAAVEETSYVYMSEISNFTVRGDETEIRGFIDELTATPGIRVKTYGFSSDLSTEQDGKNVTYQPVQRAVLTLVFYMI